MRPSRSFVILLALLVLLQVYIGMRLLPDLMLGMAGNIAAVLALVLLTVLVPIGLFLTYKALHDSQLYNKEFYFRFGRKVGAMLKRKVG